MLYLLKMFYCWKILVFFALSDKYICFCLNTYLYPSRIILFEVGCLFFCWLYIYIYIYIYIYVMYVIYFSSIACIILSSKLLWKIFKESFWRHYFRYWSGVKKDCSCTKVRFFSFTIVLRLVSCENVKYFKLVPFLRKCLNYHI